MTIIHRSTKSRSVGFPTFAQVLTSRLRLGVGLFGLALAGLLVAGLAVFGVTDQAYRQVISQSALTQDLVVGLNDALLREVLHTRAFLLTNDPSALVNRQLMQAAFERAAERLRAQSGQLSPAAVYALTDLEALHSEYMTFSDDVIGRQQAGDMATALALFEERSEPLVLELLDAQQGLRSTLQAELAGANAAYAEQTQRVTLGLGLALVALVAAGAGVMWPWVTRPLTPLGYFEHSLVETVRGASLHPVRLPDALPRDQTLLFQAYNQWVEQWQLAETAEAEFVARVAHDLRSPLAIISGYAGLLTHEQPTHSSVETRSFLQAIERQTRRMGRVLDQMVIASRLETHQWVVEPAPLRLARLLRELAEERTSGGDHQVTVASEPGPDLVLGDALGLRVLFDNLLDNALKLSPTGAPVAVTLRPGEAAGQLEVAITDQGPGIAASDLPRLFQRFGQVAAQQDVAAGAGLGLYIARQIAEQHHGAIAVQSEAGRGTTVRVTLPVHVATDPINPMSSGGVA
jgi:signal transduction histidine kinase